jgi:hypothetical protein
MAMPEKTSVQRRRCALHIITVMVSTAFALTLLQLSPALAGGISSVKDELSSARAHVAKGQLQDARKAIEEAQKHLSGLNETETAVYTTQINRVVESIAAHEDSLVNVNLEILRSHGSDSALNYMQEVVWAHGVSKEKLDQIENTILSEPPKVNEAKERDDVAYALQLLESNQPMDPTIDPYIVKTAEMIFQSRDDSLKNLQASAEVQSTAEKTTETQPIPEPVVEQPPQYEEAVVPLPEVSPVEPAVDRKPAPVAAKIIPEPKRTAPAEKPKKPEEYTSPALLARAQASKEYLKKFKANQAVAQKNVVELYEMIENGQGPEAMRKFRDQRAFISKHVSPQVFNVLELTLAQTVIDAQKKGETTAHVRTTAHSSPEEQTIKRLDGLMRQNKVEAAYREFTRDEPMLKSYLSKKEFKLLKNMIEDAYELRTGKKIKKKK